MKSEARPHSTCSTFPLLNVGFRAPDSRVIGHVVVRREQLDFGFARINHKHDVVDSDRRFGYVSGENDLKEKLDGSAQISRGSV